MHLAIPLGANFLKECNDMAKAKDEAKQGELVTENKPVTKPMFISAASIQKEAQKSVTKSDPEKEASIEFGIDLAKPKRDRSGKADKVPFVRLRIGIDVTKEAKFEPGMRADLLIDPVNGLGLITRLPHNVEEGWLLSPLKRNAKGDWPLQLRFTWHERQPSIATPTLCSEVQVTEHGIQFKFPEGTSFTRLADVKPRKEEEKEYKGPLRRSSDRMSMNQ